MLLLTLFAGSVRAQEVDGEAALVAVIRQMPATDEAVRALQYLCGAYRTAGRPDDALALLAEVRQTAAGLPLDAAARCLSVPILVKGDKPDRARDICLSVVKDFAGSAWAAQALYDLGELYLHVYGDRSAADSFFTQLARTYPESGLAADASAYLQK